MRPHENAHGNYSKFTLRKEHHSYRLPVFSCCIWVILVRGLQCKSITDLSHVTLHLCVYLTGWLPVLNQRMYGESLLAQYSILLKTATASTSQNSLTTNTPSHSFKNFSCPWSSGSLSGLKLESRRLSWIPSIDLTRARNISVGSGVGQRNNH